MSPETKARLRTLAEQRQLSESALLKRLLELTLEGAAEPKLANPDGARRVARAARLYLRLRPDDQLLLAERAAARGMAAATYVSVLVRAHLRCLTPLPKDELVWRMHFMFGTLAYTLAATDTVQLIAGAKPEDRYDARLLEERLTAFMSGGLLAPLAGKINVKKAA